MNPISNKQIFNLAIDGKIEVPFVNDIPLKRVRIVIDNVLPENQEFDIIVRYNAKAIGEYAERPYYLSDVMRSNILLPDLDVINVNEEMLISSITISITKPQKCKIEIRVYEHFDGFVVS